MADFFLPEKNAMSFSIFHGCCSKNNHQFLNILDKKNLVVGDGGVTKENNNNILLQPSKIV